MSKTGKTFVYFFAYRKVSLPLSWYFILYIKTGNNFIRDSAFQNLMKILLLIKAQIKSFWPRKPMELPATWTSMDRVLRLGDGFRLAVIVQGVFG